MICTVADMFAQGPPLGSVWTIARWHLPDGRLVHVSRCANHVKCHLGVGKLGILIGPDDVVSDDEHPLREKHAC